MATKTAPNNVPARHTPGSVPTAYGSDAREIRTFLESQASHLMDVARGRIDVNHLIKVATQAVFRNPTLLKCSKVSILTACIDAADLALELNPSLGEGYLIPYWSSGANAFECQFRPGYRGLVKLVRRSGEVDILEAQVVRAGDVYHKRFTPELEFVHEPGSDPHRPIVRVYSKARWAKSGTWSIEDMTFEEIEKIHRCSEGYKFSIKKKTEERGPWVDWWEEMARKTVVKRHAKSLPMSTELAKAISIDNQDYVLDAPKATTVRHGGMQQLAEQVGVEPQPALPDPSTGDPEPSGEDYDGDERAAIA